MTRDELVQDAIQALVDANPTSYFGTDGPVVVRSLSEVVGIVVDAVLAAQNS